MQKLNFYLLADDTILLKENDCSLILDTDIKKKKICDIISQFNIKNINYNSKRDILEFSTENEDILIHKYMIQCKEKYFSKLANKISTYNKNKLKKKMTLIRNSIAVGIVTISMGVLLSNSIKKSSDISVDDKDNFSLSEDSYDALFLDDESIITLFRTFDNTITEGIDMAKEKIEENKSNIIKENVIELNNSIKEKVETKSSLNSFGDLANITDYDDVIRVASNIYMIDYNIAKDYIYENMEYIVSDGNSVSEWGSDELDRIKDLKKRSIINPDIVISGIFIKIKDLAYSSGIITSEVIISTKTTQEKEQDIINVARYVYGVEDEHLLSVILAANRLESANCQSNMAINKNNLGGNRGADLTFNSYKTCEMGAESMVRNLLNNYDRSFYREDYNINDSVCYNIAKPYCYSTSDSWAAVVDEKSTYILENNILDDYIDRNVKINR